LSLQGSRSWGAKISGISINKQVCFKSELEFLVAVNGMAVVFQTCCQPKRAKLSTHWELFASCKVIREMVMAIELEEEMVKKEMIGDRKLIINNKNLLLSLLIENLRQPTQHTK
jgi:hypothetical protein